MLSACSYLTVYIYIYIYITECGRTEINTTKEMSENVVQPGIEPGSPDPYIYIYIYIYYESKRIRKISVTLSFTPWGDRQTVFYYGEKHTLYTIIYDITACEDIN